MFFQSAILILAFIFPPNQVFKLQKENHALYLSVIQIKHQQTEQTALITIKVFTDDFENAIKNAHPDLTILLGKDICQQEGKYLEAYFEKHLAISINGTNRNYTLQNCQQENEVYFLELEMPCPLDWKEFKIEADFLMELFPTQSNMINLIYGNEKRYCRLTKKESTCELSLRE